MSRLISIDPGNKKCGLLLVDIKSKNVIDARISSLENFSDLVSFWCENHLIDKIIIGDGTNCRFLERKLQEKKINNLYFVDESGSTMRARFRYWELWPPKYIFRFFPKELLFPPENLDAIVAMILVEDLLNKKLNWPNKVNIKIWP